MNYGLTFDAEIHDAENEFEEKHIVTMPIDYLKMEKWAETALEGEGDRAKSLYRNYACVWQCLSRRGKLAEYGIGGELTVEVLEEMMGRYTVFVDEMTESAIPLAGGRPE